MKVKIRKINDVRCLCEMPPLPVKCCIILIYMYARLLGSLSREGSLSCHTYWDMDPRFLGGHTPPQIVSGYYSQGSTNINGINQSINDYFIGGDIT